jgi:hypothetical protein
MALQTNLRIVFGFLRCIKAVNCSFIKKISKLIFAFQYNDIHDDFPYVYLKFYLELEPQSPQDDNFKGNNS